MHPFLRSVKAESTVIDPDTRRRLARYIKSERRFYRRQDVLIADVAAKRGYGFLRAEFMAMTEGGTK